MTTLIITLMTLILMAAPSHAQIVALFAVNQPPQFQVDAGDDLTYVPGLILQVAAIGGTSTYTYLWSPAQYLNDPTSPTPEVLDLLSSTLFTVQVTDVGLGCTLTDEVLVDYNIGMTEAGTGAIAVFPNPSDGLVRIQAAVPVRRVLLRSPSGALVLEKLPTPTPAFAVDVSHMPAGVYFMTIELVDGRSNTQILCATSAH